MRALILSAGLGERLRPLTLTRAKPAIHFLNVPMLGYPYFWLSSQNITDLSFNTHHLPDTVRRAAISVVDPATQLHFTHEDEILGSGGGIWNARFHLMQDDSFAVTNGDAVVTFAQADTLEKMWQAHEESDALATMLVCPREGVGSTVPGVWFDSKNQVANFGKEASKQELSCLHYASFMFVSKRIWQYLPPGASNILYDVFMNAIAMGEKVLTHRVDTMYWFETGDSVSYLNATNFCLNTIKKKDAYGKSLINLLDKIGPSYQSQSDLDNCLLVADSAKLQEGSKVIGSCVIGAEAVIRKGATVENCVILPGAEVNPGEYLKDCIRI